MNDISLDTILLSIKNEINTTDVKHIYNTFKKKYSILNYYVLIEPSQIMDNLSLGDIIRYANNNENNDTLSTAGIIVRIDKNNNYVNKIFLKSMIYETIWMIYPFNYFIFKYEPTSKIIRALYQRGILRENIINNIKFKNINTNTNININTNTNINTNNPIKKEKYMEHIEALIAEYDKNKKIKN